MQFEVQFISLEKSEIAIASMPCQVAKNMTKARAKTWSLKMKSNVEIYEQIKESDFHRKNVQLNNIKGTEAHKKLKLFDSLRKSLQLETIKGTDLREQLKTVDCQRKIVLREDIKGTDLA